jgi:hypothetical protein
MWRGLIVALVVVASDPRAADACTCAFDFQVPARDVVEVPVNMRELVFYASPTTAYGLYTDLNEPPVPLGTPRRIWGDSQYMSLVPIAAPLQPNTAYMLAPGALMQFRTTAVADDEPPGVVALEDIAIRFVDKEDSGNTCGVNRLAVSGRLVPPADAASIWVRFRGAGTVQERLLPPSETALWSLGTAYCNIRLDLQPDTTYELDVWARDLAGNEGPVASTTVHVADAGGCATTRSSGLLLVALSLMIRRRRVAGVHGRA